jgi:hypothetical protein
MAFDAPGRGARLYIVLAIAAGLLALAAELVYLAHCPIPFDPVGYLVGRDFVNTWMGAKATLAGNPAPWFDPAIYNAALQQTFGSGYPKHNWSYPPHFLLFTAPLGFLPYLAAYAVWAAAGLACYLAVAANGERRLDRLVLLALAPAVIVNIGFGQIGFVVAALMIAGLVNLDRRPVLAGVMFGLLTIKPQLGLLLPLMLLLTGRWRVIGAAVATFAALFAVTSLVFGLHIWSVYLDVAMPAQMRVMTHDIGFFMPMMPTVFMNMRLAGFPLDAAFAAQAVISVAIVAAVVWTFMRRRDPVLSQALLVTATFVALPYAFNYDMVVFGWVLSTLIDRKDNEASDYVLMLAVLTLPVTTGLLGFLAGLPISSFVLVVFAARLVRKLREAGETPSTGEIRSGPSFARFPA